MKKLIELHSCAISQSIMSFPLGAVCIKTAINCQTNLPKAEVFEQYLHEDPIVEAQKTAKRQPYAVGLSVYVWNQQWFVQFGKELKKILPSVILFVGGPQVSVASSIFGNFVDFIVIGEGEIATVNALKDGAMGIVQPIVPNLEELESPFLTNQTDCLLSETDSVLWELTRGCPFHCSFCFESRGSDAVRNYPFKRIEKELQYLVAHEIKDVFVLDPTFNLNMERAKKILRLLIEKSPSFMHFTFEIRAELIDKELAELFSQLNCSLQIGLQSADEQVINSVGRKFNKELFSHNVKLLAQRGVAFGLDVIIGLPNDNLQKFKSTIDFAVSLMPSNIDVFLLSLLEGTELTQRKDEFGLVCNDTDCSLHHSSTFSNHDIAVALQITSAMNLFYTKGQSCMWIHCILETLNITACNLFLLFDKWMKQTGRSEDQDIWELQDSFVESLFIKTQNNKLIAVMKSFMELHQGLCYVTDTGNDALLNLSYNPDDLALLDRMSLSEFVKTHKIKQCKILLSWDDEEGILWKRIN